MLLTHDKGASLTCKNIHITGDNRDGGEVLTYNDAWNYYAASSYKHVEERTYPENTQIYFSRLHLKKSNLLLDSREVRAVNLVSH